MGGMIQVSGYKIQDIDSLLRFVSTWYAGLKEMN